MRWVAAMLGVTLVACGSQVAPSPSDSNLASGQPATSTPADSPTASPPPPGHELYGFVPYWEMDASIAAHVATTPLTTLGLFSVTSTSKGALDRTQSGYRLITGSIGQAMITAAHHRGARVELVFTSFGAARNASFFGRQSLQDATIGWLVDLVRSLGVDGIDVDVESLDLTQIDAYGAFVGRLRTALTAFRPDTTLSVATGPGPTGVAMALAALAAGADRVFLMGYDYRTASSDPGAVSPIERSDDGRSLTWTLDLYGAAGVPPQRLLLGLPLYGMAWPVVAPVLGAPSAGDGAVWVPRRHLDLLGSAAVPTTDPLEGVEIYLLGSDGTPMRPADMEPQAASPADSPSLGPSLAPSAAPSSASSTPAATGWTAIYVDSPATLERKLGLGESRGLVGAGFWAIGYERGLPAYTDLMARFAAGSVQAD